VGSGVISVLANVMPNLVHKMTSSFIEGKAAEACQIQLDTIKLTKSLFCEVNPIPVKAALNMMGYNVGTPRLPLVEMSEKGKEKLKQAMQELGLM